MNIIQQLWLDGQIKLLAIQAEHGKFNQFWNQTLFCTILEILKNAKNVAALYLVKFGI